MSGMPGPSSRATTQSPVFVPLRLDWRIISPDLAYSTMLRETSEIAAAIRVASTFSKPMSTARARPCWRAATMSVAEVIGTCVSLGMVGVPLRVLIQMSQAFLQVQRGADPLERQAQLH